jgi:hypothetical protein
MQMWKYYPIWGFPINTKLIQAVLEVCGENQVSILQS